jgi:SPP1 family predicted phage head-tail adaptor
MQSGKLRHRVVLQAEAPSQDATTGAITNGWTTFATVWASVEPLSAREFIAAGGVGSGVVARVVIRYLAGVVPSMRIVHGSRTFNIEGVLADKKSGTEYLTLPVSEVVNG